MTSSSPAPKLPLWIFFAMDAIFVAVALAFWAHTPHPWSEATMKAIVACLICGAVIGLVPPLIFYERRKNEMLDDRQNALESLARTIHTSAEQVSIAANGLNELVELSQKQLRQSEQLPHKLQEKMAEFQAQLSNVNDAEKEELEKELEELRSTESERLQSTSDKIAKTTAEFAKLEASTQQHLTAANEAIAKLAMGTANAIGKAQAAAEQALAHARQEAARGIGDAAGNAVKSIEQAKTAALHDVATRLDSGMTQLREVVAQLQTTIEKLEAARAAVPPVAVPPAVVPEVLPPATPLEASTPVVTNAEPAAPTMEPTATPPKRPRKQRREESHEAPTATPAEPATAAPETAATPSPEASLEPAPAAPEPQPAAEVPDVAASASERSPAAPAPLPADSVAATASPTEPPAAPEPVAAATSPVEEPPAAPTAEEAKPEETPAEPVPEAPKPARKRARKPEDDQPHLGLELDEPHANGGEETGVVERVLTSDGATRLLVTAYIGIGNRLFIRGSGPGLSWDRGIPLQFVSIGKWRWETNEATTPVQCKLLKNDEQECSALGTLNVDPGHQHEVTATF